MKKSIVIMMVAVLSAVFLSANVASAGARQGECCFSHSWISSGEKPSECLTEAACSDIASKGLSVRCYFIPPATKTKVLEGQTVSPSGFRCFHEVKVNGSKTTNAYTGELSCKTYPATATASDAGEPLQFGADWSNADQLRKISNFNFMEDVCSANKSDNVEYRFQYVYDFAAPTGQKKKYYSEKHDAVIEEDVYSRFPEMAAEGTLKIIADKKGGGKSGKSDKSSGGANKFFKGLGKALSGQ